MSCTTYRVTLRDPIQDNKRIEYENLLLKFRLQNVRPAIEINKPSKKLNCNARKKKKKKKKHVNNYGRRLQINQENATLLKRILNLEARDPIYGKEEDQKHLDRFFKNQVAMKRLSKKFEETNRHKENELLRRRLRSIRPTIDIKTLNAEAKSRRKIIKNMSRYRKRITEHTVNLERLQVLIKETRPKYPKTARKRKKTSRLELQCNTAR